MKINNEEIKVGQRWIWDFTSRVTDDRSILIVEIKSCHWKDKQMLREPQVIDFIAVEVKSSTFFDFVGREFVNKELENLIHENKHGKSTFQYLDGQDKPT